MDFDRLQIKEHLQLIYKHRKLILLTSISVMLPLSLLLLFNQPKYQSSVSMEVADDAITGLLTNEIDVSPDLTVGNYMDILTSQNFARRVVRAVAAKQGKPSEGAREQTADGAVVSIKRALGFTARTITAEERAIIDLLDHMQTDHRGGEMIKVTVESADPEKAYLLANTISEEFRTLHLETLKARIDVLSKYYQQQLLKSYERLVNAEADLDTFRRTNNVTNAKKRTMERLDGRLENLESQLIDLRSQRKLLEDRVANLTEQLQNLQKNTPSLARVEMQLPRIEELKKRLVDLQTDLNTQAVLYTEKHPKIVGLKREIDATILELRTLAGSSKSGDDSQSEAVMMWHDMFVEKLLSEVELNNMQSKEKALESLGDDYRKRILQDDANVEQTLVKLEREVKVAQDAYQSMLQTNERVQGLDAEKALNVNVVSGAEMPLRALPRKRGLKLAMGFVLGMIIGVAFGYLREALDRSIKTIEDVEKKVKLPIVGYVVNRAGLQAAERGQQIVVQSQPQSDMAENFRAMRTQLGYLLDSAPEKKIIMVTSPGPGEGKSTIAANLAAAFALYGQKTVLLDTDLYRPASHNILGSQKNAGLSDWLTNQDYAEELQKRIQLNGTAMDFISAGSSQITFQKLAINSKLQTLLDELKSLYEVILIDAPPIIPVSDTALIASHSDLILMVLNSGQTQIAAARHAAALLEKAKPEYIGAVLNRLDVRQAYGPGSYFGRYFDAYREKASSRA